jgi:deoxyadenosine/deoxycytidine kinase
MLASAADNVCLLLEDFANHPFLSDFYADARYTFETEMNFLLIHYHQLLKAMNKQSNVLISDFFFDKDKLFADANILSKKEIDIFMELYRYLRSRLIVPDVIICLSGTTDMIYQRILNRNRESEKNISYEYINKINRCYEQFFVEVRQNFSTVDIDMSTNDFVENPMLINMLQQHIWGQYNI